MITLFIKLVVAALKLCWLAVTFVWELLGFVSDFITDILFTLVRLGADITCTVMRKIRALVEKNSPAGEMAKDRIMDGLKSNVIRMGRHFVLSFKLHTKMILCAAGIHKPETELKVV